MDHQELINAVSSQIRPGLCSILYKKYTKAMIIDYLHKLKYIQYEKRVEAMQQQLALIDTVQEKKEY